MAMSGGSPGSGLSNEINVTPMIDVLLVLLIIFMMVIPMSRKALDLQLPDPTPQPVSLVRRRRRIGSKCCREILSRTTHSRCRKPTWAGS